MVVAKLRKERFRCCHCIASGSRTTMLRVSLADYSTLALRHLEWTFVHEINTKRVQKGGHFAAFKQLAELGFVEVLLGTS